ncbi:hypothetical protein KIPB_013524, partial [Kipferlia bialata]
NWQRKINSILEAVLYLSLATLVTFFWHYPKALLAGELRTGSFVMSAICFAVHVWIGIFSTVYVEGKLGISNPMEYSPLIVFAGAATFFLFIPTLISALWPVSGLMSLVSVAIYVVCYVTLPNLIPRYSSEYVVLIFV